MAEVPSTRKVQITVPIADTSVIEWLDLQYSASESVRRLIRESVAREGFVDVANRPVRPPANPVYIGEDLPAENGMPADGDPGDAPEPSPAEPAASRPSSAQTRRSRSENAAASATIDDLLGL